MPPFDQLQIDLYNNLYETAILKGIGLIKKESIISKFKGGIDKYNAIKRDTGIPEYIVFIIHYLECDCDFGLHLHNGNSLQRRTIDVPKGRPLTGNPPFTWMESALDALELSGFRKWKDWSIPGSLYMLEKYNGFGYRKQGINSPYLWSKTNHYTMGKYIRDNVYSKEAVSKQIGAAVIMKVLNIS